jgi:hypothetical protein
MTYEVLRGHEAYLATSTSSSNFSAKMCDRRIKIDENVARNETGKRLPSRCWKFLTLALRIG